MLPNGWDGRSGPYSPSAAARSPDETAIEVFVHLAHDKDPAKWREAHRAGTLVGINDETPYGYGRAERMGCRITFSRSGPEGLLARFLRLSIRAATGFDYLHALRQRSALMGADIVWTHTESQYLAVAAVLAFKKRRPKVLGQSVWLFDRWQYLTPLHKLLYSRLISLVDVLTFPSPDNLAVAKKRFPQKRVVLVPFGIASETRIAPTLRPARPIKIVAPGNDRHRDWGTLVSAVKAMEDTTVVILSGTASPHIAADMSHVRIGQAKSNAELATHLAEATLVCVPLKPNKHASGITVIQEAVLAGVPVVATDTGGLDTYFGHDEVRYVPPGDPFLLREAILATATDPVGSRAMALRAQARMAQGVPGAEDYVRRHVELTREVLNR
jgi:glycosyltransferase involved in cell wall biosynthesis